MSSEGFGYTGHTEYLEEQFMDFEMDDEEFAF
jgi:hypothetical protein